MFRHRYTVNDSPAVVARIDNDLCKILDAVQRADPHLRSLVLTGGFARGEGATLAGIPQNDYDLVAIRSIGRPHRPYPEIRRELERSIGLHIDLAPVASWRLPWVSRSIFWYETALRGRVLNGPNLLSKIPIRDPTKIDPKEALRLLVNRSAGLLLSSETTDPYQRKLQAAKALLAALDVRLLATGQFLPSQRERWNLACDLRTQRLLPSDVEARWPWFAWAYDFKVDPAAAPPRDARDVWFPAANALLGAVPYALKHAGLSSLEEYGVVTNIVDQVRYFFTSAAIPGAHRFAQHPTGSVRVATIRLLESSLNGTVPPQAARIYLGALANIGERPLADLEALRRATLQ